MTFDETFDGEDVDTGDVAVEPDPLTGAPDGAVEPRDMPDIEGSVIEQWSCSGPIEQAVIIWPDLGPADCAATPVGLSWSAPSGEFAVLDGMDLNGDGIVDLCVLDTTGSGIADTWLQDTTGLPSESTGAYFADTMYVDSTGDGLPDCGCQDPAGSGEYGDPVQIPSATEPAAPAPVPAPPVEAAPAVADPALPAAQTAPEINTPVSSPDPLIQAYSMTNDPAVQAQIARIMDIRTRAASAWL